MPALRKMSLPWYSWIFMLFSLLMQDDVHRLGCAGRRAGGAAAKRMNCIMVQRTNLCPEL